MQLNEFLNHHSISMTRFAAAIGTTVATVSRIADGQVVPRKDLMIRIFEETNGLVSPNDLFGIPDRTEETE